MKTIIGVCLTVLLLFALSDDGAAYYLDFPHNESNGIQCQYCHFNPVFNDPVDPGNPENSGKNKVCLNCHGTPTDIIVGGTFYIEGPPSTHHSSSTTSASHGTWSTQCIDCHDPHFQGQLDYEGVDSSKLYLGKGVFVSQPTYSAPAFSTSISIARQTGVAGFDDFSLWNSKGGTAGQSNSNKTTATDGTRGLLLVPNIANPNETYEVIDVTGNVMTVKGDMTATGNNFMGNVWGVIYGQSIRSFMLDAHGNGYRDVKFFRPDIVPGDFGGWVDLRPSEQTPLGICQVCHAATYWWKEDGSAQGHNSSVSCGECHVAEKGFEHSAHRSVFITGSPECGSCHRQHLSEPDWGHGSCGYCHVPFFSPEINTSVTLSIEGLSPYDALLSAGYSFGGADGRLRDSEGNSIGDPGFAAINCITCHAVNAFNFYDHSSIPHNLVVATTGGACEICHSAEKSPFIAPEGYYDPPAVTIPPPGEVHSRLGCFHCHDSGSGVLLGSALNHTIGTTSDCMTCHGDLHHTDKHNNVYFDPAVDISAWPVVDPLLTCNALNVCHQLLTGDTTSLDTWAGIVAEHDWRDGVLDGIGGCSTCHLYDGTNGYYNLTPVAAVTAALVPGGGVVNCGTCHVEKLP